MEKKQFLCVPQKKENHPVLEQGVKDDTIIILSLTIPYCCTEKSTVEFKYVTHNDRNKPRGRTSLCSTELS